MWTSAIWALMTVARFTSAGIPKEVIGMVFFSRNKNKVHNFSCDPKKCGEGELQNPITGECISVQCPLGYYPKNGMCNGKNLHLFLFDWIVPQGFGTHRYHTSHFQILRFEFVKTMFDLKNTVFKKKPITC